MIKHSLHINKGIYHVSFRIPDETGRMKQKQLSTKVKATKGNKRKAEIRADEIVAEWEGRIATKTPLLLCDYVADWIERDKSRVQKTTYDGYKHMLNKHIYPYFQARKMKVTDVKPMHIEQYCTDKVNDGLSPNTVKKQFAVIRTALQDAVKNGYIRQNPADLAETPKRVKPHNDFYSAGELKRLLELSKGTPMELPIFFATHFALRRSEILGLRWSAIDFDKNTLTICGKVTRGIVDGKVTEIFSNQMKSESSNRTFVFNDEVKSYLLGIRQRQEAMLRRTYEFKDYVCINDIGELLKPDYVTHKFDDLLVANSMKHIRFHDLRHSSLSLLVNNNFNMKLVQEYAGHADFSITANTYAHADTDGKRMAINAITHLLDTPQD